MQLTVQVAEVIVQVAISKLVRLQANCSGCEVTIQVAS